NEMFRARQDRLRKMIASWDSDDDIDSASSSQPTPSSACVGLDLKQQATVALYNRPGSESSIPYGPVLPTQISPPGYNSMSSCRLGPTARRTILQSSSPQDTTSVGCRRPEPYKTGLSHALPGWHLVPLTEYS